MKIKSKYILITFIVLTFILTGCSNDNKGNENAKTKKEENQKQVLHVAAAASLTDATKDLEKAFKEQHNNVDVTFNYGGSGALRQQIEKDAPVDVFMSANEKDV
ncbi:MAG: extracellular solute-binding protein, partial [Staphylococcus xylosus]|nr:extracellular solute-binding protein [Staphylococcus xylosus]